MAICPDRERGKWTPKVDMGKLVKSLLFARFIINRTSSFKSNYQLKTIKDMYAEEEEEEEEEE